MGRPRRKRTRLGTFQNILHQEIRRRRRRGGLQGIHHVNEEVDGNDNELTDYLYEIKVAATKNSETIQQVNSKTLNMVAELTARIKTLTDTTASQQKTSHCNNT
jgi:hypothetical protein